MGNGMITWCQQKYIPKSPKKWSGAAHEASLWCEGLWWWFALCSSSTAWLVCYLFHVPPNARAFSDRWGLLRAGRAITAASRGLRGWRGSVRFSCGRGAPRRRSSGIKTAEAWLRGARPHCAEPRSPKKVRRCILRVEGKEHENHKTPVWREFIAPTPAGPFAIDDWCSSGGEVLLGSPGLRCQI